VATLVADTPLRAAQYSTSGDRILGVETQLEHKYLFHLSYQTLRVLPIFPRRCSRGSSRIGFNYVVGVVSPRLEFWPLGLTINKAELSHLVGDDAHSGLCAFSLEWLDVRNEYRLVS
jgi:hypothetical protein